MRPRPSAAVLAVAVAAATALSGADVSGVAVADPDNTYCPNNMMFSNPGYCDAHMPDPMRGHCDGGRTGSLMSEGYCDGEPYPDGSYWRVTQHGAATVENPGGWMALTKQCVVHDGAGTRPAPPGGCDGAV